MTAGALTSMVSTSYANYATGALCVERHELAVPKWDADGFRIAVLADMHIDSSTEADHTKSAIRLALAEKPDLIALPGDFAVIGMRPDARLIMDALAPLRDAQCPVIGSLGNHDYDHNGECHVRSTLAQTAVRLLVNETVDVRGVTIAGIDDGIRGDADPSFLKEGQFSRSTLALFHEPDYVPFVPKTVSLQISGHSHGGQICYPGGIRIHATRGSEDYCSGFYPNADVPLYVTRGIGTTGPRWRLFCPPEVSILTIRRA